jgi:3-oxoadipate enol-lactonase
MTPQTLTLTAGGVPHRVRIDGDHGHWVVFSNSLGCSLEMWDAQVEELRGSHRILRYDTRGHGGTPATPGPYSLDMLAADLLAIMDAAGIRECALVGLSMGGMIAQHAALARPHAFTQLALADTTSHYGDDSHDFWRTRAHTARTQGLAPIAETTPRRWFTFGFGERHPDIVARYQEMLRSADPEGYAGCCEAIPHIDTTSRLPRLRMPVTVIVGEHDPSTTVDHARRIHAAIPQATLQLIDDAAHLSNVEQPQQFTQALRTLLEETA